MGKNGLKIQEFPIFWENHPTKLGLFLPCFPVFGLLLIYAPPRGGGRVFQSKKFGGGDKSAKIAENRAKTKEF